MQLSGYLSFRKQAYDYFKDGIIFIDSLLSVVYLNETASRLLDVECGLMGMHIKDISNEIFLLIISATEKKKHNSKKLVPHSIRFTGKNGTTFTSLTFISGLGNQNANLGYVIIIQDSNSATELNITTAYERMPFLRALNVKNDEFFYISDIKSGRNIFCSQSVENFLGWEAFNFVNGTWAFAISKTHPEDVHLIEKYYKQRLRWKKYPYKYDHIPLHYKYRMLHKKGHYVHVSINAALLQRNSVDEPVYIISFGKTFDPANETKTNTNSLLTVRESQVLNELEHGKSYKMAAAELNISIDSIRTYVRRIYQKLDVHSVTEAIHKNSIISQL